MSPQIIELGQVDYTVCLAQMQQYTLARDKNTPDQFWILEHPPVFTQGQAGKPEHLLIPGNIPVIQTDRGGQITYHGPGQLIIYLLVDLKAKPYHVKDFVCKIEQAVINCLTKFGIISERKAGAPGIYVDGAKICQLGLRVKKGCSYHGLSLNIDMDLSPFKQINPCGYKGLEVVQVKDLIKNCDYTAITNELLEQLTTQLGYKERCLI